MTYWKRKIMLYGIQNVKRILNDVIDNKKISSEYLQAYSMDKVF